MNRIAERLATLKAWDQTALIPFITAGDPNPEVTVPLMRALVEAGADLIELGVPFSDPMADGPVIQRASERALAHRTSLRHVLSMVHAFRQADLDTPVILMGYLNPIEVLGYAQFAEQAREAGVDGVLVVDLPPEESQELAAALRAVGIDLVYLIAPTSTEKRIRAIGEQASGFVYYVSLKGVTGAGHLDLDAVAEKLEEIRQNISLPVGVGFGIQDAETAAAVARVADAVIVGSALVKRMESLAHQPDRMENVLRDFLGTLRAAIDRVDQERSA